MDLQILERNFRLIEDWCKKSLPKSEKITIDFPHHIYYFAEAEFENGNLILYRGSHGWGRNEAFDSNYSYSVKTHQEPFYHYLERNDFLTICGRRKEMLNEFIENWHKFFKPKFEKRIEVYENMMNFSA